ncbi:MAG: 30S ribosomal protein S20 [Candidatus Pacebacteria bacterium]|jgi:ribosomal protein S20|nr:30S ribosomal protein S20 [Candidatus Paceibacterota bacterium]MBT3511631.1 30S ribosomal protein S20 [Candidatus Paceibacterota bacterium]MBT4004721.1 30S ribosomal protein S20 [Candidatus Paceibacterota bacterium]MBT4359259.1 30S ribosomal protein S20 [Candidatus Paceibacterota bacterium]MBT4681039.1 30S ribosomal protein S20 [Candidatus Paceibacterota bacterium]
MPVLPHAKKALRASKTKAQYNRQVKSVATSAMKKMTLKPSKENLTAAYQAIDKTTKRKVYHHNRAARLKSKMAKLLK